MWRRGAETEPFCLARRRSQIVFCTREQGRRQGAVPPLTGTQKSFSCFAQKRKLFLFSCWNFQRGTHALPGGLPFLDKILGVPLQKPSIAESRCGQTSNSATLFNLTQSGSEIAVRAAGFLATAPVPSRLVSSLIPPVPRSFPEASGCSESPVDPGSGPGGVQVFQGAVDKLNCEKICTFVAPN